MIALIAGHNKRRKGASNKNYKVWEHDIMSGVVDRIASYLTVPHVILKRPNGRFGSYRKLIDIINDSKVDVFISFHANAFDRTVDGCETLYHYKSAKSKALATDVQSVISGIMDNDNRGIKPKTRKERGGVLLEDTDMKGVLVEPFFVDNDYDLEQFARNYQKFIRAMVSYINKQFGEGL